MAHAPRRPPSGGDCSLNRARLPLRLPLRPRLANRRLLGRARTLPCAGAPCLPTPCVCRCRPVLPRPVAKRPPLLLSLTLISASALPSATRALPVAAAPLLFPLELAGARPRYATFRHRRPRSARLAGSRRLARLNCRRPSSSLLTCLRSSPFRCRRHPPCRRISAMALAPRRLPSPSGRTLAISVPRRLPGTSARAFLRTRSAVHVRRPSAPPPASGSGCGGLPAPVCA